MGRPMEAPGKRSWIARNPGSARRLSVAVVGAQATVRGRPECHQSCRASCGGPVAWEPGRWVRGPRPSIFRANCGESMSSLLGAVGISRRIRFAIFSRASSAATLAKLERYEEYVFGIAGSQRHETHYRANCPDGFEPSLVFLVRDTARQASINKAIPGWRQGRAGQPLRVLTRRSVTQAASSVELSAFEEKRAARDSTLSVTGGDTMRQGFRGIRGATGAISCAEPTSKLRRRDTAGRRSASQDTIHTSAGRVLRWQQPL